MDERWFESTAPFTQTIVVPFPPESSASGLGRPEFHPVLWYRRTFRWEPTRLRERLLLHFGAVDHTADVWVNGHHVARHEGGHTPFTADVTAALDPGQDQVIVVRALDRPQDLEQPRGKQDWLESPHNILYGRTSGIWQEVWLEPVPETRIGEVRWTPDLHKEWVEFQVRLAGPDRPELRLEVEVELRGRRVNAQVYSVAVDECRGVLGLNGQGVAISWRDVLWAPEHPNLFWARLRLLDDAGEVVDEAHTYFGVRELRTSGDQFLLNGRPYFLRLVLSQGYWPESHLASPRPDALRREVELIKQLGFNGVRLHQKVEDARFLYWCDRLGLAVWAELPATYKFSHRSLERLTTEWIEVLRRDHNHPSILAWVPFNESWGVPNLESSAQQREAVRSLYHLAKALDGSRLVVGNDGWELVASDIITIHDYDTNGRVLAARYRDHESLARTVNSLRPHYRRIRFPEAGEQVMPVMITECGGLSLTHDPTAWDAYGAARDGEELFSRYVEIVGTLLDSSALAGFCYTQLCDVRQEKNGLLDDNRVPKVAPERLRRVNRRISASVPGDRGDALAYGGFEVDIRIPEPRPAGEGVGRTS